jgi:adenosylcobinamide-GDP ribazoletransferase
VFSILGGAPRLAASLVPEPFVAAIVFGLSIVLTGAIHVDGFLDTCDAAFAQATPQRRLEILKDPRTGSFAVAYFAVAAACWLAALFALPVASLPQTCALAAGSARLGAVLCAYDRGPSPVVLGVNAILVAALAGIVAPWAWTVLAGAIALALLQGAALRRALGTLTGDAYGCIIVCGEIAALAGSAILFHRT